MNYREAYGIYACNGILFNHESPRRGETFVTRKITRARSNIAQGLEHCLYLGNLDALRDWGYAKDYVRMQWMMLQQEQVEDFVIATGKQISVRDFVKMSAAELGITLKFEGEGAGEYAIIEAITSDKAPAVSVGDKIVAVDPRYFRPAEVETLLGDPSKAKEKLGWEPEITVEEMCTEMVATDLKDAQCHAFLKLHGFDLPVALTKSSRAPVRNSTLSINLQSTPSSSQSALTRSIWLQRGLEGSTRTILVPLISSMTI